MVFSGIVSSQGTISSRLGKSLVIQHELDFEALHVGCSVAVNGACLTVTKFSKSLLYVDLAPETLRLTNLGNLCKESAVNLEMALTGGARNSGHYVQGHVDCTGVIESLELDGNSTRVGIKFPGEFADFLVYKGFVAIDGVSLTICQVSGNRLIVMLVPHTKAVIRQWLVGDSVNLEFDCMGKYSRKIPTYQRHAFFFSLASLVISIYTIYTK